MRPLNGILNQPIGRLGAIFAASVALFGCAYNATGAIQGNQLTFEYSLAGPITESNNLGYYFVVNNSTAPSAAPLVNGPAPATFPYPDPRSYLPFVRDESDTLDRQPVPVPSTYWTDYFALYQEAGQMVMWQGRKNADNTINEHYRQLQQGREWGFTDDNKTVQITLQLSQVTQATDAEGRSVPPQLLEGNLAVATRNYGGSGPQGYMLDRWGIGQNQFFTIDTSKPGTQDLYNTVAGVTFPENLGGVDPNSVNLVSLHYKVATPQ
ncbi:MAG TPA: hypothetical protein V6D47_20175 [Oscillatoriaceae cyanobacterium]